MGSMLKFPLTSLLYSSEVSTMPYKDKDKQKEYQKRHYQNNKASYKKSGQNSKAKICERLKNYKKDLSCLYCGKKNVIVFHHNGDKSDNFAEIIRRQSCKRT